MSEYRRWRVEGGTFFFTAVTYRRQTLLTSPEGRGALREAFERVRRWRPFGVVAIVLLPDHLHTIWELPRGDSDYTTRWRQIKTLVTRSLAGQVGEVTISASRRRRAEHGVWQRRFYEHTCRDEADVKRLVDYIHVNPVKHRLSARVRDWPWSSFHRYEPIRKPRDRIGCPGMNAAKARGKKGDAASIGNMRHRQLRS